MQMGKQKGFPDGHPMIPRSSRRASSRRSARESQRGFALLLVFAMAAVAAIFLYMQLPRVAFEAQRDREEMLIERGKEYRRAIELYVRKNTVIRSAWKILNGSRICVFCAVGTKTRLLEKTIGVSSVSMPRDSWRILWSRRSKCQDAPYHGGRLAWGKRERCREYCPCQTAQR
jgi:hypothetical protein